MSCEASLTSTDTTQITLNLSEQRSPVALSHSINTLMLKYCDSIADCSSIPRFSILPAMKIYFGIGFGQFLIYIFVLVLIINIPIFAFQILSGKPKRLLVGKSAYKDLLPYFEGAYHGDLSWFKFARVRYLSVILLTYHAQSNLNALNLFQHLKFKISCCKSIRQ